jgi:radical SAM superfamily enzyme YgiQ (UPF0313 family)
VPGHAGGVKVLLILPPMVQVNTPYPATAFLTGYLRKAGIDTVQADLAIELVLKIFCRAGLERLFPDGSRYADTVDSVIRFLQGKDPSLALRIASRNYLPEGPRFAAADQPQDTMQWAFGALGVQDRAKFLATLYLADLTDIIRERVDARFELSRYAEKLAMSAPTFDPLSEALRASETAIDGMLKQLVVEKLEKHQPDVVGITAPFPGNVYAAFRIAACIRSHAPKTILVFGGGYPNTELREMREPRVFDYFDFVTLDDGERPLQCIVEHLEGRRAENQLCRTFLRRDGAVTFVNDVSIPPLAHADAGTPTYDGLPLDRYLSVLEMLNPMHRIWSDGRWNKLMVAHGCYWSKCTFCDTTLDYIHRYSTAPADHLVDQIERIAGETGQSGFHFVDEAAPPAMLKSLAKRLIDRGVHITWWGNIRFEKSFTEDVCELLAESGCVAVSGGLEVAEDRLLKLMQKGVSVEQVARITRNFTDVGVMVHAYLMYGFPTQTVQETVNALEYVRQLFDAGCIQSGYWHRFALTAHSPIALDPAGHGIRLLPEKAVMFARNEIPFEDPTGTDHASLGEGLRKAIYNFMHGAGLEADVRTWFGGDVPKSTVPKQFIARALEAT